MNDKVRDLADWLDDTVSHIVTKPGSVKVDVRNGGDGQYNLIIYVDPVDRGLIIGAQGTTIDALRLLARKQAYRLEQAVKVDLAAEKGPKRGHRV